MESQTPANAASDPSLAAKGAIEPRKPIDRIEEGDGIFFTQRSGDLRGALRYGGELFQCQGKRNRGGNGGIYWAISGEGDRGDRVNGLLFWEQGRTGPHGRPNVTGRITTVVGHVSRRMAGWVRTPGGNCFYSVKLTEARSAADTDTLELPFEPALPASRTEFRSPPL